MEECPEEGAVGDCGFLSMVALQGPRGCLGKAL